jgi:hypothetical protein
MRTRHRRSCVSALLLALLLALLAAPGCAGTPGETSAIESAMCIVALPLAILTHSSAPINYQDTSPHVSDRPSPTPFDR